MAQLYTELQLRGVPRAHFLALNADGLDASTWCADLSEVLSRGIPLESDKHATSL